MDLENAIKRAQILMSEEYQQKMDAMTPSVRKKGAGISDGQLSSFERQAFGYNTNDTSSTPQLQYAQAMPSNQDSNLDKLPEFLRESAKKTPIGAGMEGSYMYSEQPVPLNIPPQQPQQSAPSPQMSGNINGIDYNYIKYLVETAIKENTGHLNESAGAPAFKGMRLVEGNKFQFIDSKGNLYEAVLTLKKRANAK